MKASSAAFLAGMAFEAYALVTDRAPTVTELADNYPLLKPALIALLVAHFYRQPTRQWTRAATRALLQTADSTKTGRNYPTARRSRNKLRSPRVLP